MNWKLIKHFKEDEFRCHHCGASAMEEEFVIALEAARIDANVPFSINSGYRCPEYDKSIGGEGNHPSGKAVDIACTTSRARFRIVSALVEAGFTRIGIGKGFIHADMCDSDTDGKPQEVIWLY